VLQLAALDGATEQSGKELMFSAATIRRIARPAIASIVFVAFGLTSSQPGAQEPPKKLSDWLLEQPRSPEAYPLGLSWRVPSEIASQEVLRREMMHSLSGLDGSVNADRGDRQAARLPRTLPVTPRAGRRRRRAGSRPTRRNPVIGRATALLPPDRRQRRHHRPGRFCPACIQLSRGIVIDACDAVAAGRAD
jgi:hypothetical protein